jgi:hypothetical protein
MIESLSVSPALACLLLAASLFAATAGCRRASPPLGQRNLEERTIPVQLGDTTVNIVEHTADSSGLTYVNLHDDENTSVEAVLKAMRREGGRLIELQHTGERNISFVLGDSAFAFDPNRMFTPKGRRESLAEYSADSVSAGARAEVESLADSVLDVLNIETVNVVVAVHNNTDNSRDGNYSALSYTDEGEMANEALFAYLTDDVDPDDFFFVTERSLYNQFRNGDFNAVMQDNSQATDDGSLSVYCGQHGVSYVNVEAQHGHLDYQLKMLAYLNEIASQANQ